MSISKRLNSSKFFKLNLKTPLLLKENMKILVLMKRFGTNKDLVMQNFGRQVRLFEQLQRLGHKIDFLCMDYRKFESKKVRIKNIDYYIEPFNIKKFNVFLKKLNFLLKNNRYDFI